jgi:fatty-acyl-CoA synthase
LEEAAPGSAELVFHLLGEVRHLPARTLLEDARRGAAALASMGVRPGDAVGILGPNRPEWARWAFASWLAGAVVVPLPFHLRIADAGAFEETLDALVRAGGCRVVLADPRLLPHVPGSMGVPWTLELPRRPTSFEGPGAQDPAVVQFTSGSTATPKGAILTHQAVLAGVRASAEAGGLAGASCVQLSWLPFFHDWGLFGYLVWSVVAVTETHILPTERFAKDPSEWFRLAGAVGATMTPGPSSAWRAALRMAARRPQDVDLSTLRLCTLAAEAIDPSVVDDLLDAGRSLGLRPEAVHGAYGMAEATLAISVSGVGTPLRVDSLDRDALSGAGVAAPSEAPAARRVPSCGPAVPGVEIRIGGGQGDALPERRVGEIHVRGPSLMTGYLDARGTSDPFAEGWLPTGDLGYVADGELFVTGRTKDIVIVMGRNYAAQDIEWAAERASEVRAGRCVAFGRAEAEGEVVIAAEANGAEPGAVPRAVWTSVSDALGVVPREVIVLPRGTIPLTTSGKLRRSWVREAYARGDLHALALAVGPGVVTEAAP